MTFWQWSIPSLLRRVSYEHAQFWFEEGITPNDDMMLCDRTPCVVCCMYSKANISKHKQTIYIISINHDYTLCFIPCIHTAKSHIKHGACKILQQVRMVRTLSVKWYADYAAKAANSTRSNQQQAATELSHHPLFGVKGKSAPTKGEVTANATRFSDAWDFSEPGALTLLPFSTLRFTSKERQQTEEIFSCPLVMSKIAIENGHWNSGFSH